VLTPKVSPWNFQGETLGKSYYHEGLAFVFNEGKAFVISSEHKAMLVLVSLVLAQCQIAVREPAPSHNLAF